MAEQPTYAIVGASLAGTSAAAVLRREGFDGRVILIGAEPHLPYDRPPLSKEFLRSEMALEEVALQPAGFYETERIELRLGVRVVTLDPVARSLALDDGSRIRYDKVLIATGARNRRLPIPGIGLEGVYSLRSVDDAHRIRAEIAPGRRAVLLGMGFIGSEVTASLRQSGVEVVVIEADRKPFQRSLGEVVAGVIEEIHRDEGVRMLLGETVAAFAGSRRVEAVTTAGGCRVACDFAIVGVGVEPAVEAVAGSGVLVRNGIVVDEHCRTNVEDVYAAGDVANHYHRALNDYIRVEHWQNAKLQGAAGARSMLGQNRPYAEAHWFWSDQYEHNLQCAGLHAGWDDLVVRGSLKDRRFTGFYLCRGRLLGAVALNRGGELRRVLPLIGAQAEIDPGLLQDEDVDLRKLMRLAEIRR